MTCSECSTWDDSMKGVYICPKCGSPEMVKAANEPMADMESLLNYSTILEGLVQQLQTRNDELRTAAELFLELKGYL